MGTTRLNDDILTQLRDCTSPSEVMALMVEDGVELSDEQLETVAGGIDGWSFEQFLLAFGDKVTGMLPDGFDPASIWGNLPVGSAH